MVIRPARAADLARLADIEVAAGEQFRALGMAAIADDAPPSTEEYEQFLEAGRAWVAVETDSEAGGAVPIGAVPIGYGLALVVDGNVHIEQVTVHPDGARRGIGAALLATVQEWARGRGASALTLTTFRDVPWNAPYYARLGFVELPASEYGPELAALVAAEAAQGLARWPRVVMRRAFTPRD